MPRAAAVESSEPQLHVNKDGSFRILQIADRQDYYRPEEGSSGAVNVRFREVNTIVRFIWRIVKIIYQVLDVDDPASAVRLTGKVR